MKRYLHSGDDREVKLSILMIVIGLVLALWPGHVMNTALVVLGIALLAAGGILIYSWYTVKNDTLTFIEGVALAGAGLVVLIAPKFLVSIIPFAVGAVVMLNGILNLAQALDQKRADYSGWTVSLGAAILTIALGALILRNPFTTMEMLVVAIGVVIIYNGVSNLLIEFGYRKMNR